jgi:hypothetical protein
MTFPQLYMATTTTTTTMTRAMLNEPHRQLFIFSSSSSFPSPTQVCVLIPENKKNLFIHFNTEIWETESLKGSQNNKIRFQQKNWNTIFYIISLLLLSSHGRLFFLAARASADLKKNKFECPKIALAGNSLHMRFNCVILAQMFWHMPVVFHPITMLLFQF